MLIRSFWLCCVIRNAWESSKRYISTTCRARYTVGIAKGAIVPFWLFEVRCSTRWLDSVYWAHALDLQLRVDLADSCHKFKCKKPRYRATEQNDQGIAFASIGLLLSDVCRNNTKRPFRDKTTTTRRIHRNRPTTDDVFFLSIHAGLCLAQLWTRPLNQVLFKVDLKSQSYPCMYVWSTLVCR